MMESNSGARSQIDTFVSELKTKVPPMEHGAIDSRLEELLNDPTADSDDVVSILGQEFNPQTK